MNNQNIVITGTSRGIGYELARQCLEAGHAVAALSRSEGMLAELRARYGTRLQFIACDVSSDNDVARAAEAVSFPHIDLLFNNSGILEDSDYGFADLPLKLMHETFEVNTIAPMRVLRTFLPRLLKAPKAKVAVTTSLMGSIGDNSSGGYYAYRMSKAALNMMIKSFAQDYPKLVALTLHPGWVRTEMGGPSAPTTPEASAHGLLKVVREASLSESGRFYDFEGDELPW